MPLRKQPIGKLYYRIGEVAEMFKVNTSLIRFYEKEFDKLKAKVYRGNELLDVSIKQDKFEPLGM